MDRISYPDGELLHGDCLDLMRDMEPGSVDLIFGSPPYEDSRLYLEDGEDLGIARNTEQWVDWMVEVVKRSLRVSRGLVAFVVGHGKGSRRWSGGPALLCADLIRAGVCLRRPAWFKRNGIMGSGGKDWLRADVEWIVCAANDDGPLPWSDNTACGKPSKYPAGGDPSHRIKSGKRVNDGRGCRKPDGTRDDRSRYKPPEIANPGDVIDCGVVGGGHMADSVIINDSPLLRKTSNRKALENEAPFPEKLAAFFVRSFCPPGGVVYDPFGGSGTTVSMAIKYGRKFIASDIRASQVRLMQGRVKQARTLRGLGVADGER